MPILNKFKCYCCQYQPLFVRSESWRWIDGLNKLHCCECTATWKPEFKNKEEWLAAVKSDRYRYSEKLFAFLSKRQVLPKSEIRYLSDQGAAILSDWLRTTFDLSTFEIHDVNGAVVWAVMAATCKRIRRYPVKLGSLSLPRDAFEIRQFEIGDLVLSYDMSRVILNRSERSLLFKGYPFLMCDCLEDFTVKRHTQMIGCDIGLLS